MPNLDITSTYLFLNAFASPFCDPLAPAVGSLPSPSPEPVRPPNNTPSSPHAALSTSPSAQSTGLGGSPLASTAGTAATGYVAGDPRGEIPDDRKCEAAMNIDDDLSALATLLASSTAEAASSLPSSFPGASTLPSAPSPFAPLSASAPPATLGPATGVTGATGGGSGAGGTGSGANSPAAVTLANLATPPRMPVFATCNCGNVRVTVRKEPGYVVVCQCACCRRFSGGL